MPPSFGLSDKNRVDILEQFYFLMSRLKISYEEIRRMPLTYRKWFIDRVIKDLKVKEQIDPNYGVDTNTPLSSIYRNR